MPTDRQQRCKNANCRRRFTRPQSTNRLYCFECRPERKQVVDNVVNLPPSLANEDVPTLVSLTKTALREADRLDSWQAMACIKLAELIDSGKHGTSGPAGTIKAHREAMQVALAGANQKANKVTRMFAEEA